MIVNKKIREVIKEISAQTIAYMNSEDKERKYLRSLLKIYKKNLTEDEQIFILKYLLEFVHYKNITIDPENIITMNNIKLRHYFLVLLLVFGFIIITLIILFQTNALINILEQAIKFFKFLGAV